VLVIGLDLRGAGVDWAAIDVAGAAFAGCRFDGPDEALLRARGAVVLPAIDGLGFEPYRSTLYSHDELMAGYEPGRPETTYDSRVGTVARIPPTPLGAIARGIHDACIDAALLRFLEATPRRAVGVMGSHATARDHDAYRVSANLGRALARAGYLVVTGGGPGLMEAANLGARLAGERDDALDDAIAHLGVAPDYVVDPAGYLETAREVRARWPDATQNVGVPTWMYVDEPVNQFTTHLAKYFENSIREEGLLAVALGGVIFTPGGSGTAQEIFTDAAQNTYALYGLRSPMIFLGRVEYEASPLVAGVRALAVRDGWDHLIRVVDDADDVLDALRELLPPAPPARWPLRRRD
jgi:predicted Rossmann-fold nucleotide-binding protein